MESENKFYTIQVQGPKPANISIGFIDSLSGQPKEGAMDATQTVGETTIPNYSSVWGKLEKDKKGELTGSLVFYDWGDERGELVEIRYMKNSASISLEFQKFKKQVLADQNAEITVKIGLNKFDRIRDKRLVELLEHHSYNSSNKSRDPENHFVLFSDYAAEEKLKFKATDIERRQEAENIVLSARHNTADLKVIGKIFEKNTDQADDYLFNDLIKLTQNYKAFFTVLETYAKKFKEVLLKSKEAGLIEYRLNDNTIMLVKDGHRDIFLDNIEAATEEDAVEYLTDNITRATYFYKLDQLSIAYNTYVNQVLQ